MNNIFYLKCVMYSVERYNVESNTWTRIADMNARRSGSGVGVVDNILFAIGKNDVHFNQTLITL